MLKTNDARDRVSYSSILLPPDGFTLNFAVGTTYSLELEALAAMCFSLSLSEDVDTALMQNPVTMLNALQKVSERVLIFCEAGQIKMPGISNALSLLLERMIIPVALPKTRGISHYPAFHPKTWILQYVNRQGEYQYRFAVLSRNLTFDRSWDVSFAMDSSVEAKVPEKTQPLLHYLEYLSSRVSPSTQDARAKRRAIRKLMESLDGVCFTTDSKEFGDNFEIMPLGIGQNGFNLINDPLFCQTIGSTNYSFNELVIFSPFISGSVIEYWNKPEHSVMDTTRVLITRKSELSKISADQCSRFQIYTIKDDIVDGENAISDENTEKKKQDIHAKIFLRKKYSDVDLYLGSMNATYSAVHKNVEILIRLRTKNRYYNSETFLRELFCGSADNPQNPFEMSSVSEAVPDIMQEKTNHLEQTIKLLCRLKMAAAVTERDGKYDVSLNIDGQLPQGNISITPFRRNNPLKIENQMMFLQLDILQVSEFYSVRVASEDMAIERVIMIPTKGIPANRENAIVDSVVKDKRTFMEYVAFVLGESNLLFLLEGDVLSGSNTETSWEEGFPAIYEKMLKTALDQPEKITEIGYLLKMITNNDIVPDEFRELYATFKKTLKLK